MVRTVGLDNYSDEHFTDRLVAKSIVDHFQPSGLVLEPCRGLSAFYDHLPPHSLWCEISEGRDFFDWTPKVHWIITNPPFSNMTEWMDHAFSISENVVFLIPISKLFSSSPRLALVKEYSGIREMYHVGTGRSIGFNTGFPFAAIHFQK